MEVPFHTSFTISMHSSYFQNLSKFSDIQAAACPCGSRCSKLDGHDLSKRALHPPSSTRESNWHPAYAGLNALNSNGGSSHITIQAYKRNWNFNPVGEMPNLWLLTNQRILYRILSSQWVSSILIHSSGAQCLPFHRFVVWLCHHCPSKSFSMWTYMDICAWSYDARWRRRIWYRCWAWFHRSVWNPGLEPLCICHWLAQNANSLPRKDTGWPGTTSATRF